jgi:acyl-CoA dehydrogenase
MIFPRGKKLRPPLDSRNRECAQIALEPGAARERLTAGMYVPRGDDATAVLEAAFAAAAACEPIEKKLRDARRGGAADPASILTPEELAQWQRKEALRKEVIRVDDFPQDFGRAELALAEDRTREAKAA